MPAKVQMNHVKIFVAWDFSDGPAQALLDGCREFADELTDGRKVEWLVPGVTLGAVGTIGRDIVEKGIREADRVIALVDNANANVGWEAGLAIGLGKPVSFAVLRPKPAWAEQGALAGQFLHPMQDLDDLSKLAATPEWSQPKLPHVKSDATTSKPNPPMYVLCPGGVEGANLRKWLQRDLGAQVRLAPAQGNTMLELPGALAGCTRAIWVICTHTEAGGVDGHSNASNALIAGILRGWGLPLQLLRSSKARSLADVSGESRQFNGMQGFQEELRTILTASGSLRDGPELPHPIQVPTGLDADRLQTILQTRFPDRSAHIEPLAARVGVTKLLPIGAAPDQLWYDILQQARYAHADIRPLIQALLGLEPENAFLRGIAGV